MRYRTDGSILTEPIPMPSLERLSALFRISLFISESLELDELLDKIVQSAVTLLPAERCVVMYKVGDEMKTKVYNFTQYQLRGLSRTVLNKVFETKEPLLIQNIMEHPDFKDAESIKRLQLRSIMVVPLKRDDDMRGLIYVDTRKAERSFNDDDLLFLQAVANLATLVLFNAEKYEDLKVNLESIRTTIEDRYKYGLLVGKSEKMQKIYNWIENAKDLKGPFLLIGETGTGKELVARTLYDRSTYWKKGFYVINCPAIPRELVESELFGHVKGAFTGATRDKIGKLREADGGTIFLDEIGYLDEDVQAKLLRFIETGEIQPIGSNKTYKVDVRIIAASEEEVEELIRKGKFRSSLYYRFLDIVRIPPLRERMEDVPLLAHYFLEKFASREGKHIPGFTKRAMSMMLTYNWPGNVRELEKTIERAVHFTREGEYIDVPILQLEKERVITKEYTTMDDVERDYISQVLKFTGGNKRRAAEILGVTRKTLYNKIKKYRLPY